MGKLTDKVAVITGATAGMALATAKLFAAEGAYVYITGRRADKLEEAVNAIGQNVTGVRGDAANPADNEQTARLEREARVMAQLQHRNICHVYEFGRQDEMAYIAMEYVRGTTLSGLTSATESALRRPAGNIIQRGIAQAATLFRLKKKRSVSGPKESGESLSDEAALEIFRRVCDGVAFAHDKGILHRDLKPGNILLREDGEPLVVDFGLAKLNVAGEASLSMTGQIFGTLAYMAPEQAISAKDADERADVYALGAILYYLLSGHRAFRPSGNIAVDVHRLQNHQPVPLRKLRPDLPGELELIVMKALQNDSRERYANAGTLRDDVDRYLRGDSVHAQPLTLAYMLRRLYLRYKTAAWVTAVIFLAFLVLISASLWQINEKRLAAESALRESVAARRNAELARAEADTQRQKAEASEKETKRLTDERVAALRDAEAAVAAQKSALAEKEEALAEMEKARTATASAAAARQEAEQKLQLSNEQLRTISINATRGGEKENYPDTLIAKGANARQAAQSLLDEAERAFMAAYSTRRNTPADAVESVAWTPPVTTAGLLRVTIPGWQRAALFRFGRAAFAEAHDRGLIDHLATSTHRPHPRQPPVVKTGFRGH